jgi:hypothetical protein
VPVRIHPARASLKVRVSDGDAAPDNRTALVDQALFAGHHAAGLNLVIQTVWLYDHAVDLDRLRHFNHNLNDGLLGRLIERSPLRPARFRWVSGRGPLDVDIAHSARPRAELSDWADERSQIPIDAESGPGWHLGVLPLTDGTTAVTMVLSHYLIDGLGLAVTITDAVLGNTRDFGYPPPRSRSWRRAVAQDGRLMARDVRDAGRALVAAAKLARKQARAQEGAARTSAPRRIELGAVDGDDPIVVPAVWVQFDAEHVESRGQALGATGSTLIAALAAKFGEGLGRRRPTDGIVTLHIPVSERTEDDTRANAMSIARVTVDPTHLATDLRDIRTAIKQALKTVRETPDESLQLRALIPFTPKRALKRMVDAGFTDPDVPLLCSNMGDFGPVVCLLDGTRGELVMTRATGQGVTRQWLERAGGQMTIQAWRAGSDKIYFTVNAYQPGAENTKPALRELAARTLSEFGLTGEID